MGYRKAEMTPENRLDELMTDIVAAICLAANTTPDMLAAWEHRAVLDRIRMSCKALIGIQRRADPGPWVQNAADETIHSADFKHDVFLKVYGDFWDAADRAAYMTALTNKLNSTT